MGKICERGHLMYKFPTFCFLFCIKPPYLEFWVQLWSPGFIKDLSALSRQNVGTGVQPTTFQLPGVCLKYGKKLTNIERTLILFKILVLYKSFTCLLTYS